MWKIEKFSHLNDEKLQSPPFISQDFAWEFSLQKHFVQGETYITIQIHILRTMNPSRHIKVTKYISIALIDCNGSPFVSEHGKVKSILETNGAYKIPYEVLSLSKKINDLDLSKVEFFPNDILTVRFRIWKSYVELCQPVTVCSSTQIESVEVVKNFDLKIYEEHCFQNDNISIHLEPIVYNEFLTAKLLINEKNTLTIVFNVSMMRCELTVELSLLDAVEIAEYNFTTKEEVWIWNPKFAESEIMNRLGTELFKPITLHFRCSLSKMVTYKEEVEDQRPIYPLVASNQPPQAYTISEALLKVLQDKLMPDLYLRVEQNIFPVHKVILSARSKVFKAMFAIGMNRKADNCIEMKDVDAETLQELLTYLYSNTINFNMGCVRAASLYDAADKYALEPLCYALCDSNFGNLNIPEVISQDMLEVLRTGILADLDIKLGHSTYPVHKVILSARSHVFRKMFYKEMQGKATTVEIRDMDEATLQRMLKFIYADRVDIHMDWQQASAQYTAAVKYAIEPLKQACSEILQSSFSTSNILEILKLAIKPWNKDLQTTGLAFMKQNDNKATCKGILQYVFEDKIDMDMGCERALDLYVAANKYALESLKQSCSEILKSNFSVLNISKMLHLADTYNDQNLKSAVLDFMSNLN